MRQKIKKLNYVPDVQRSISRLKAILNNETAKNDYGTRNWIDCLASVHFLRKKELKSDTLEDEVLQILKSRKPYLDNDYLNKKAYDAINIFIS